MNTTSNAQETQNIEIINKQITFKIKDYEIQAYFAEALRREPSG